MLFALPTHMGVASAYTECCGVADRGGVSDVAVWEKRVGLLHEMG